MIEQTILSKEAFIEYILSGAEKNIAATPETAESALPEGFEGFDATELQPPTKPTSASFAQFLLEKATGFGLPELVQRDNVIRSSDAVAKHLPPRASFWPKTSSRPYQTLLFEADLNNNELKAIPAFKGHKVSHLDDVEAILARMVSEALEGFQRGGEGVTADVRKGRKDETLCVISILDEREGTPVRLVCFGTQNKSTTGLETFIITEQTRFWEPQLARDHLGLLYERQFKKLIGKDWQEAFTTTEERNQADKLLKICTRRAPKVEEIQEGVLDLLDMIAKGFGLRKKANAPRRLQAFELPRDHDIGIDPEERERNFKGQNPFSGFTLRDERSRLLGYIVYPLDKKADAARLHKYLEQYNRFHNVLVIYPDEEQASLELWQGREQLVGKLRKGQGHKDAADVVNLLSRFFVVSKAKVRNPAELAQELAYRARYLRRLAVKQLQEEPDKGPLRNLYNAFKEALVHDQTEEEFADAFAQTITYGLLTARWIGNDQLVANAERFTRQTALKHLPAASPFLNDLFKSALSVRLDEQRGRLLWLVDDIADLLDRIDVTYVFGAGDRGSDQATDPVIHFYEPFLAAYDKELKNKRGVFFTPRPVVSYIVRSVHELLQTEFSLEDGLASTDTWGDMQKRFKDLKLPEGVKTTDPFVCVLDPATGTGTFLFECIEVIERTMKERWCRELKKKDWKDPAIVAEWNEYVPKHLLPRLYGFELMMASYAIAHLKLSFKLGETGYHLKDTDRIRVFLTNSLEPPSDEGQSKFGEIFPALAQEAKTVNEVKHNQHFTVVIGNPPYSIQSQNLSNSARAWVDAYKYIDGEAIKERGALQFEKNIQDDYVKFIRFAQSRIDQAGYGILTFITNHSYLSTSSFRGMRKSLMETFDNIYNLDLHGNSKKKERCPDGTKDENVFDIQLGVAIGTFIKLANKKTNIKNVAHADLWGIRELYEETPDGQGLTSGKYCWLWKNALSKIQWILLAPQSPSYLFVPQDIRVQKEYEKGWKISEAMPQHSLGIITARDHITVNNNMKPLLENATIFRDATYSDEEVCKHLNIPLKKGWDVSRARRSIQQEKALKAFIKTLCYRPFDYRFIFYHSSLIWSMAFPTMRHMLAGKNLGLCTNRQVNKEFRHVLCTRDLINDCSVSLETGERTYLFPLYLYPNGDLPETLFDLKKECQPNFSVKFITDFTSLLNIAFVPHGKGNLLKTFGPEDVFSYIYAIFHSPTYRSRYSEFLKLDFPRLPLPRSFELFRAVTILGSELIALHLMESQKLNNLITEFIGEKSTEVEKIGYSNSTVWIDKKQTKGFKGVSEEAWDFHIGSFQVCEKWLKDRKGRTLSKEDIEHYQKIIVALNETIRIMKEIDEVIEKHGGWPGAFAQGSGGEK
ncbi:MAG: type ISP restriction/modification enzyme [Acidobacteriota bacterium]